MKKMPKKTIESEQINEKQKKNLEKTTMKSTFLLNKVSQKTERNKI